MITHKVHLDTRSYASKPTKSEIGSINSRLIENPIEISIEELSHQVVQPNGKTWVASHFEGKRKNDNWKSQSIFALDFDCGIIFSQVLERLKEYGLSCCFAYNTFSDSSEMPKFRVVFQLRDILEDRALRKTIQLSLEALFPEIDKSCKDENRIFFGGKSLLYTDYDAFLDLDRLIEAAQFYSTKESSERNYKRDLKRKKKKLGLNQNGRDLYSPYIYTIGSVEFSSKIDACENKPDMVRSVDFNKLRQEIKILDDFMHPTIKLPHPELLGLATNLRYLEGGQILFHECIDANPDYDADEKHKIMHYCCTQGYFPMKLESFSPYEKDWEYTTLLRAAKRKEIIRLETPEKMPIQQAREKLGTIFNSVISSDDTHVHVIKVPTGIGKTEICTRLDDVLMALPNHALKAEVSERMKVEHQFTPELDNLPMDVKKRLEYFYSIGAISEANRYLKELSDNNDQVANYLNQSLCCYGSGKTVLTTHQKALFIDWKHETIIFDEDIISTLLPIGKTTLNDLIRIEADIEDETDKKILSSLVDDIREGRISAPRSLEATIFKDFSAIQSSVLKSSARYDSDILHFFDAEYFMVNPNDQAEIYYIRHYPLIEGKKIIILSATADETIYRHLLGDRLRFYDIGFVEMTGLIEQDTKYSFSRSSLNCHLKYAQDKVQDLPVITFAKFKKSFANAVEEAHFGKTTGFDGLKGQNIAVLGTPHVNPITLILYSKVLGMKVRTSDFSQVGQQVVENNGFRFWFNAYDNLNLRHLQFYFIETELRQAVGRARVNTELAYVCLLSNYPLPEASVTDDEIAMGRERLDQARRAQVIQLAGCLAQSANLHPTTKLVEPLRISLGWDPMTEF
jgi:hypothetical protein